MGFFRGLRDETKIVTFFGNLKFNVVGFFWEGVGMIMIYGICKI